MKKRKAISLFIIVVLCINLFAGCSKKPADENPTDKPGAEATEKPKGEPTVIRIGTRYQRSIDPFYRDPKTGETNMTPEAMRVALESVDKVKEELNVDLKWVPYTGNPDEILLTAVLANDPVCELADEANRKAIGQNILQYLDEYKYLFDSPDYSWMFPAKVYGHHLLLNKTDSIFEHSLVYNINYIEKVDALKNNGKIELPSDMWEEGKWTWSSFEDYLSKIQAYYSDKKAPVRQENSIQPYFTDLRIAAVSAINANGQAVLGQNGFGADTKEAKEAVSYVDNLYLKKFIGHNGSTNVILEKFQLGECVFADLGYWQLAKGGGKLAERGEAMGIVPFPKPDNSTNKYYRPGLNPGQYGILKGISKEKTKLAVETFKLYYSYAFECRNGQKISFKNTDEYAKMQAISLGVDVTNEKYSGNMLKAFKDCLPKPSNDIYVMVPWFNDWNILTRNSIMGINKTPKYDVAIDQEKDNYISQVDEIQQILNSDKIVDNILPNVDVLVKDIVFPVSTDGSTIDWSKVIKATDNVDGDIDAKDIKIDATKVDFSKVGQYTKALVVTAKDKAGNEKVAALDVKVFDPKNTQPPVLVIKEKYRDIKLNEDTSMIKWANDFVDKAESAEGLNIKNNVFVDVSQLDVTKEGKYDVVFILEDFAKNKVEAKVTLTVGK